MVLCGYTALKTFVTVPLKTISVDVDIKDFVACVKSSLEYVNDNEEAVEANFSFPMDDESAVYHFEVDIDGKLIIGECQEKKQAEQTYQDAKFLGHGAYLMREADNTGDIFQMSIGNLGSKKKVVITFHYVVKLRVNSDGAAEFILPEILNPRYDPAAQSASGQTQPFPKRRNRGGSLFTQSVPYSLQFTASVSGGKTVENVTSNTVSILWDKTPTGVVQVKLSDEFKFDSDIQLLITYDKPHTPNVVVCKGSPSKEGILKQDVVMLNFFPEVKKSHIASNVEFIFVVDRSGSMRGSKMEHVKRTLLLFLKSLPVGCCFNVISFGSNYDVLFPEGSRDYSEESLKAAMTLQSSMEANMGGTEILRPLQHMYNNMDIKQNFSRQVFILTDGEVSNTRSVVQLVGQNAHHSRVFSFGIGQGASTALVKGIARAGKGRADFITEADRLESKVVSSLRLAMEPSVMNCKLEWKAPEDITVFNVPSSVPVIFSGEHLVMFGLIQGNSPGNVQLSATLSGQCGSENVSEVLTFQLYDSQQDSEFTVHRLAAKQQIKQLEDQDKEDLEQAEKEEVKMKLLLLSTSANLVSKHTAFVGVDKDTREVQCRTVDIPPPQSAPTYFRTRAPRSLGLPAPAPAQQGMFRHDFHNIMLGSAPPPQAQQGMVPQVAYCTSINSFGGDMGMQGAHFGGLSAPPATQQGIPAQPSHSFSSYSSVGLDMDMQGPPSRKMGRRTKAKKAATSGPSGAAVTERVVDSLEAVIGLQKFDGSWQLSQELIKLIEVKVESLKHLTENEELLATALVLTWFEVRQSEKRDEWSIIAEKAVRWLNTQSLPDGQTLDQLKQLFKQHM